MTISPIILKHLIILAILTNLMSSAGSAEPSSAPYRLSSGVQCMDTDDPIYIADQRIAIRGRVMGCENGVFDITRSPNAIRPGERLMLAACRYSAQLPNAIIRGRMNTPYLLNPASHADMGVVPYVTNANYNWENGSRALPFVPTEILDLGTQQGYPVYAYTGLRFLPSRVNDAYPLNAASVIIAIDGCAISSPDALAGMLHFPAAKDCIEVTYYQADEPSRVFRRAFIPMYPRALVDAEWTRLTRAHPIFDRDRFGQIAAAAAAFTLVALIAMFSQSETGQALIREHQRCVQAAEPLIIC